MNKSIDFTLPIETKSEMNMREHWAKRYKRLKAHKQVAFCETYSQVYDDNGKFIFEGEYSGVVIEDCKIKITLTRNGKKKLDYDNLASSFKGIIDGICSAMDANDGDIHLEFKQTIGNKIPFVTVKIEVIE